MVTFTIGRVPLISRSVTLRNYADPQPGVRVWIFTAKMLSKLQSYDNLINVEHLEGYWGTFEADEGFPSTANQHSLPLPPTFSFAKSPSVGRSVDAKVRYRIKIAVPAPPGELPIPPAEKDIIFTPRPGPMRDPGQIFEESCEFRLEEPENGQAPRKSGVKSFFKSTTKQKFCFSAIAHCPKYTNLEDGLNFAVQVRPSMENSTASIVPPIIVDTFAFKLFSRIDIRIDDNFAGDKKTMNEELLLEHVTRPEVLLEERLQYRYDETIALPSQCSPERLYSTFYTPNVIQSYRMMVTWKLRCLGKTETIEKAAFLQIKPLSQHVQAQVLPQYTAGESSGHSLGDSSPEGLPPPPYNEAKG